MKHLLLLTWLLPFCLFSQDQANVWYFGNGAGLDFNQNPVAAIDDGQTYMVHCSACHAEGTSVICDSEGELLFYTNGETIWNRNHNVMSNGDDIAGGASSSQSSLILPRPGSNTVFYVFTTDEFQNDLENGLRYSLVDICRYDGLGSVDEIEKNISLLPGAGEKLTAVKHANGDDYWVIVHEFDSNNFHAFLLTSAGISDVVVSGTGSVHSPFSVQSGNAIGQMKASPDGTRLAIVNANCAECIAEMFDFNAATGVVSNPVNLHHDDLVHHYGVSFSPDNTKLYLGGILNSSSIYQYDLLAGGGDPEAIWASRTLVTSFPEGGNFGSLQLAPDGKIYAVLPPFSGNASISVINYPDSSAEACGYEHLAIDLSGGFASYGLPNLLDSYTYQNGIPDCLSTSTQETIDDSEMILFPNPAKKQLTIKTSGESSIEMLVVYDFNGAQVRQVERSNAEIIKLDVSDLQVGIYKVIIWVNGGRMYSEKLVVSK